MSKSDVLDRVLRALMAAAFTGATIYGFLTDKVSPEAFIGFVGMVIVYYFQGHRQASQRASDQATATNGPNGGPAPEPQSPK